MNENKIKALMEAALARGEPVERRRVTAPSVELVWQAADRHGAYALLAKVLAWYGAGDVDECTPGQRAVLHAMLTDEHGDMWLDLVPAERELVD